MEHHDAFHGRALGNAALLLTGFLPRVTVTSSANPSVVGDVVRFTATLASSATATGAVVFDVDGVALDGANAGLQPDNRLVSPDTPMRTVGLHTVTAAYSGGVSLDEKIAVIAPGGGTLTQQVIGEINDERSCQALGGRWTAAGATCTVARLVVDAGNSVQIDAGVTLSSNEIAIDWTGGLVNRGRLTSARLTVNGGATSRTTARSSLGRRSSSIPMAPSRIAASSTTVRAEAAVASSASCRAPRRRMGERRPPPRPTTAGRDRVASRQPHLLSAYASAATILSYDVRMMDHALALSYKGAPAEGTVVATNRRNVLKQGASLIGAATAAVMSTRSASAAERETASSPQAATGLTLHGRAWRIESRDLQRGVLPPVGVRMLTRGELVDQAVKGRKVGTFFATYHRLSAPGKVASHEPGSLELHTFVFSDGTIVGSGVASAASESEGHFAIVGGTGKYLGVSGAYVATQRYVEFGGNGTATFTFTFV